MIYIHIDDFKTDNLTFKQDGSFMGSTNFVKSLWLPDIQIFKCKQFKKRQIVTDVAGKIPFIMYLYSQASI